MILKTFQKFPWVTLIYFAKDDAVASKFPLTEIKKCWEDYYLHELFLALIVLWNCVGLIVFS